MKLRWSKKADNLGHYIEAETGPGAFRVSPAGDGYVVVGPGYNHDEPRAAEKWQYRWREVASMADAKAIAQQWEDEIDAMFAKQQAEIDARRK